MRRETCMDVWYGEREREKERQPFDMLHQKIALHGIIIITLTKDDSVWSSDGSRLTLKNPSMYQFLLDINSLLAWLERCILCFAYDWEDHLRCQGEEKHVMHLDERSHLPLQSFWCDLIFSPRLRISYRRLILFPSFYFLCCRCLFYPPLFQVHASHLPQRQGVNACMNDFFFWDFIFISCSVPCFMLMPLALASHSHHVWSSVYVISIIKKYTFAASLYPPPPPSFLFDLIAYLRVWKKGIIICFCFPFWTLHMLSCLLLADGLQCKGRLRE